jgi:low temperature requirement protein LtrA
MAERLGLFTIIVFGEVVLGVVNGISKVNDLNFSTWLNFALALSIVFALWWIFFAMTSNRNAKTGFVNATLLELLCIPTLMSLGLIAARFSYLFDPKETDLSLNIIFCSAIATFLTGISLMMGLLVYAEIFNPIKKSARRLFACHCAGSYCVEFCQSQTRHHLSFNSSDGHSSRRNYLPHVIVL